MSTAVAVPLRRRQAPLIVLGGVIALLLAFSVLADAFQPGPSGAPSSAYATTAQGFAAWAQLLARFGHPVSELRTPLASTNLNPADTLIVLDPDALLHSDGLRLRAFVRAGGRVVAGGVNPLNTLPAILANPPAWQVGGATAFTATGNSAGSIAHLNHTTIVTAGGGEWTSWGNASAVLTADDGNALLLSLALGRGTMLLLADSSPLQNGWLGSAGNAQLALDLAGAPGRPVVFAESTHGFGVSSGLAAIPSRGWIVIAALGLAALMWALARGRRLGPPEPLDSPLRPPPRQAYVDAVALLLERGGDAAGVAAALRAAAAREHDRSAGRVRSEAATMEGMDAQPPFAEDSLTALLAAGAELAKAHGGA